LGVIAIEQLRCQLLRLVRAGNGKDRRILVAGSNLLNRLFPGLKNRAHSRLGFFLAACCHAEHHGAIDAQVLRARSEAPRDDERAVFHARRIDREKFGGEGEALVEAFIPGREMTVGVLDGETLPVVEICAPNGWYGYEEKYCSNETRYTFPHDAFLPEMQRLARAAFDATGCRGVSRVDFRVTPEGRMYALEINTSPGMTSHSLVPKAAAKAGMVFAELCDRVLRSAAHD
jgi:hypothetical protein